MEDGPSPVAVIVSETAWRDMTDDCRTAMTAYPDLEVGAPLYGRTRHAPRTIEIGRAGTVGANVQRGRDWTGRDHDHDVLEWLKVRGDSGMTEVAHWHVHPGVDEIKPSDADRSSWSAARHLYGLPWFLGLVLTPHPERGWDKPVVSPYTTRRHPWRGVDVTEPARLIVRGS